jgi:hypothetical protein
MDNALALDEGQDEGDLLIGNKSSNTSNQMTNVSIKSWNETAGDNNDNNNEEHQNFFSLVTIVLPVLTIVGNWAVIISVIREKSLQSSTNFLIVSLAVADLMVGLIVMPWGIFALV